MVLAAHSDASFLTETNACSRAGAHIFLTDNDPILRPNGPILSLSHIIKFIVASAAEAKLAALYITACELVPLRTTLEEMGWPQPKTPVQTRQLYCCWVPPGYHYPTSNQDDMVTPPLAPLPRSPRPIPLLLGSRFP